MHSATEAGCRRPRFYSQCFSKFLKCSRGNIAIIFALMAPMFVGGLGMGVETALWYADQRNM